MTREELLERLTVERFGTFEHARRELGNMRDSASAATVRLRALAEAVRDDKEQ